MKEELKVSTNGAGEHLEKERLQQFKNAIDKFLPYLLDALPKKPETDLKQLILTAKTEDLKKYFPIEYPKAEFEFNVQATGNSNNWRIARQTLLEIIKARKGIKPDLFDVVDNEVQINFKKITQLHSKYLHTPAHLDWYKKALEICEVLNKHKDLLNSEPYLVDIKKIGLLEFDKGEFIPDKNYIYHDAK